MADITRSVLFLLVVVLGWTAPSEGRKSGELLNGDRSFLFTSDDYSYREFNYEIYDQDYIVFSVKACSDAGIALSKSRNNFTSGHFLEIKLGGWQNTRSIIRRGPNTPELASINATGLLHCGEFRTFWVHWTGHHVYVGMGQRYHEQTLMYVERPEGLYVHFVAFSTGFGHTGLWEVEENQAYYLIVRTPDTSPEQFQYATKSLQTYSGFMTFRFKGCHNAFVALGENMHEQLYRLNYCAFDNNEKMCIWFNGVANCSSIGYNYCDCNQWRQLWFSFRNKDASNGGHMIQMGFGKEYGKNVVHQWQPPSQKTINFASFATGWTASGIWMFEEDKENSFTLHTPSDGTYNHWMLTAKHHWVNFEVVACEHICIAMSSIPATDSETATYHVCLGVDGNQKSRITQSYDETPLVEANTPNILRCNVTNDFWVSYWDNLLRVGKGHKLGDDLLMSYSPDPALQFDLKAIGFSSSNNDAMWLMRKNHGDQFLVQTPEVYSDRTFWMSVRQEYVVYLRIIGEKDAVVVLSDVVTYFGNWTYEVVLGYNHNSRTVIRQNLGNGAYDEWAIVDTPNILSPSEMRTFWISWLDGVIRVGQGWEYGKREVIVAPEALPSTVNAICLLSLGAQMDWELEAEQGGFITMKTPDNSLDWNWVHLWDSSGDNGYYQWLYFQMSGGAAQLLLSKVFRSLDNGYKLNIGSSHNTMVQLYKGKTLLKSVVTEDRPVLHPDELNDYWISWEGGVITFGRSRFRGSQKIFDYDTGGDFTVPRGIALSGFESHAANWRFYERQGLEEVAHDSKGSAGDSTLWLYVNRVEDLTISIKACSDVYLTLSPILHSTSPAHTYQIVLQDGVTKTSSMWAPFHSSNGEMYTKEIEIISPDLLSCDEERIFWLSWMNGYISIGSGNHHGDNVLMSMYDFDPFPVRAMLMETRGVPGTIRVAYYGRFGISNPVEPYTLSGGEIAGLVIGYFVVLALFVGVAFLIIRPDVVPSRLQTILYPPPSANNLTTGGETVTENISRQTPTLDPEGATAKKETSQGNFENPLYKERGREEPESLGYDQDAL